MFCRRKNKEKGKLARRNTVAHLRVVVGAEEFESGSVRVQ